MCTYNEGLVVVNSKKSLRAYFSIGYVVFSTRPIQCVAVENEKAGIRKEESLLEYPAASKKATDADNFKDKPIDPSRSRSSLITDLLLSATESGDLKRVKYLLVSGEHIEFKGPESWTEEIREYVGDPPIYPTSYTRHSYPETTALYRAAYADWFETISFLIGQGADINTRNG